MTRLACAGLFIGLFIALLSIGSALPAAAQASPAENQPVKELKFEGNKTVSDAYLVRQLSLTVGKNYTRDALNADYKRIGQLGFFSVVEVITEQVPGGVRLTYRVTENLVIGEITFVGFDAVDKTEIRPLLNLTAGKAYSEYLARLDRQLIERKYRSKGYQFAHVRELTREKPPKIEVRFRVDEGPLVTLDKIRFEGNQAYSAKELHRQMQLQESGWWWFSKETFDPELLREDVIALVRYYRAKGFLDAEVALSDVIYAPDKTSMSVDIHVEEGPQYTIDKIEFVGNALFTAVELGNRLKLEPGDVYDEEKIVAGKAMIEKLYGDNARIYANVSIGQVFPEEGNKVSLVVRVVEGHRVFIERIDIQEPTLTTQDKVMRRELLVEPGAPFNVSKIRRSQRRLLGLDYFDSVKFEISPPESGEATARDLIVKVKVKETGAIRFAAGVTSNAGLVGELSLTQRNFDISRLPKSWSDLIGGSAFQGAGQFFQISLQPGSEFNRFSITFREPHVNNGPYSFGFQLSGNNRTRETYDETRFGLNLSTRRRFYRDQMTVGAVLGLERINIDADSDAPRDVEEVDGSNSIASLTLSWGWDKSNQRIQPSSGYRLGASVQLAAGDFTFVKNNYRASYYYTTHRTKDGRPYVLTLAARVGLGGGDLPIFARYFAGGYGSVRGYAFRSVSPRQGEDDEVVGGNYLTLAHVEYSIPAIDEYLRIVTFLDVGGAGGETRAGLGFGFRLRLPFFGPIPLAFDFAIPLNSGSDDDTEVFSFSLGRSF